MNEKLKVGMVGVCGFGAWRRKLMRQTKLFDLIATYDFNADAMLLAKEEDGALPTKSYEDLLAVKELDAVVISTGAESHAEQAVTAMQHGLHVFIEKPLASTMDEVRAILAAQKKTGLIASCGHADHSSNPLSQTIKHKIDSGELGKIITFSATTSHSGGLHIKPGEWRGVRDRNPGGMLFQCGVHKLHELIYYFGPVSRIHSVMRYDLHETDTADIALCQVEFKSGVVGTLNAYHITPCMQDIMITGTQAAIFKDGRPWEGEHGEWIQRVPSPMDGSIEKREPMLVDGKKDACGSLKSFYRAITEGGVPYPSIFDGALAVAPVFAAAQSAQSGEWVNVEQYASNSENNCIP